MTLTFWNHVTGLRYVIGHVTVGFGTCGFLLVVHHRLRGSASPVVKVTSHFNGKLQNLTPRISQTP